MTESVSITFKIDKNTEFLKACRGFTLAGGIFGFFAAGATVLSVLEHFEARDGIEYDARIAESNAEVFERDNGRPLEWNVTYERIPSGQRWNAKVYRSDKHDVGDVVHIVENKKGQRRIKHSGTWIVAVFCGVLATALLVIGIGGHVPDWMYWPPHAQIYM